MHDNYIKRHHNPSNHTNHNNLKKNLKRSRLTMTKNSKEKIANGHAKKSKKQDARYEVTMNFRS